MGTPQHIKARVLVLASSLGFVALLGASAEAIPVVSVSAEGLAAANAAQAAFLSGLGASTTESFETYAVDYYPALVTPVGTFSQVVAGNDEPLCSPHCSDGLWVLDAANSPAWGRFATDGDQWLDTNDSQETLWTAPLSLPTRIGFFINDPDDAGGDFKLRAWNGLGVSSSLIDLVPDDQSSGRVFYVTISDPQGLKEIRIFSNDKNDGLGIDEFTADNPSVPEPGTLSLLGAGLFAAALRARHRRS